MKFQFLKDEELFGDLPKRKKMSIEEAELVFLGFRPGLNGAWDRQIQLQLKKEDDGGAIQAKSSELSEVYRILDDKVKIRDNGMYQAVERVVDEYADKKDFDRFPSSFITHRYYVDEEGIVAKDYQLDYFEEQAKHLKFMSGYGRVGTFMGRTSVKESILTSKGDGAVFVPILLAFAAFLLLCAGGALPWIPDFLTNLMNADFGFWVRLPIALVLAIIGCSLMIIDSEELEGLVGFMANGLFRMILAIASVLCALKLLNAVPMASPIAVPWIGTDSVDMLLRNIFADT